MKISKFFEKITSNLPQLPSPKRCATIAATALVTGMVFGLDWRKFYSEPGEFNLTVPGSNPMQPGNLPLDCPDLLKNATNLSDLVFSQISKFEQNYCLTGGNGTYFQTTEEGSAGGNLTHSPTATAVKTNKSGLSVLPKKLNAESNNTSLAPTEWWNPLSPSKSDKSLTRKEETPSFSDLDLRKAALVSGGVVGLIGSPVIATTYSWSEGYDAPLPSNFDVIPNPENLPSQPPDSSDSTTPSQSHDDFPLAGEGEPGKNFDSILEANLKGVLSRFNSENAPPAIMPSSSSDAEMPLTLSLPEATSSPTMNSRRLSHNWHDVVWSVNPDVYNLLSSRVHLLLQGAAASGESRALESGEAASEERNSLIINLSRELEAYPNFINHLLQLIRSGQNVVIQDSSNPIRELIFLSDFIQYRSVEENLSLSLEDRRKVLQTEAPNLPSVSENTTMPIQSARETDLSGTVAGSGSSLSQRRTRTSLVEKKPLFGRPKNAGSRSRTVKSGQPNIKVPPRKK